MNAHLHLMTGAFLLLGSAALLLGTALGAYLRDFGPRRRKAAPRALAVAGAHGLSRYAAF
ncbi:MAG: hypothetical protein HY904_04100 [Deltaproteobacteria bacterium]|nr:hypothetical protein [Deltaproteobacteria bacterium]